MTAIAVIKRKTGKTTSIYIGTDHQMSSHVQKRYFGPKIFVGPNFMAAFTGSPIIPQFIDEIMNYQCDCNVTFPSQCNCPPRIINGYEDMKAVARALKGCMIDNGAGPPDQNELPSHNVGLVFVLDDGQIFSIDSQYIVREVDDWEAMGSGMLYVSGAIHALWDERISNEKLVRKAIEAACDLDPFCGKGITVVKAH